MRSFDTTRARGAAAGALTLALALQGSSARAQSGSDIAVRRELIERATQQRAAGDHQGALDLATRAAQISMSTSLRAFIAQEQAAVGQLGEALGNADQCVTEATRDTALRNRANILTTCQDIVAQLRARIAHVTVVPPSPAPAGLEVSVASRPLSAAVLGVPYIVTPGTVVVEARTPDCAHAFREEVTIGAGETHEVRIALHRCDEATAHGATATPPANPPPAATHPSPSPAPLRTDSDESSGPGVAPFVVAGAGVLAVGAGVVLYVLRDAAFGQLANGCQTGSDQVLHCADTPENRAQLGTVQTYELVAPIAIGVGAAALVGGILWRVAGSSGGAEHAPRARLNIAPTPGGVMVGIGGVL